MAATDTTTLSNSEHAAVYAARSVLGEHRAHPLIGPILARLDLLADPVTGAGAEPDEAAAVAKFHAVVEDIQKSEGVTRTVALTKASKDHPELMRAVAAGTRGVPLDDAKGWGRQEPSSHRPGSEGSAYRQLREKARQVQSAHPDLGMEAALERARRENPALERQMSQEMGKAA